MSSYNQALSQTTKQATYVFATRVTGYLLGFFLQIAFARLLSPEEYGLYSLAMTIVGVTGLMAIFGMSAGIPRFFGELLPRGDKAGATSVGQFAFFSALGLGLAISAGFCFFRYPIALKLFREPSLVSLLPWLGLLVVLQTSQNVFFSIVHGLKKPAVSFFSQEVLTRFSRIAFFVLFYLFGLRLGGAIASTAVAFAISIGWLLYWIRREAPYLMEKRSNEPGLRRRFCKYSSGMFFVAITAFLSQHVNKLLLGAYLDPVEVGIYTIAFTVASLSVFFLQSFNSIFGVVIAELFHTDAHSDLQRMYATLTRWIFSLTIPIVLWIFFFDREILLFFGDSYLGAATAMKLLAIGQLINASVGSCGLMLSMTRYQRFEMLNGAVIAVLNIILNILLIPRIGIVGSAVAGMIAIGGINVLKAIEVFYLMNMQPYNFEYYKPIIAGLVLMGYFFLISYFFSGVISTILALPTGFLVMSSVLFLLGLEKDDKYIIGLFRAKLEKFFIL